MRRPALFRCLCFLAAQIALVLPPAEVSAHAVIPMSGRVVDVNGNPVSQAMVSISLAADHGADFLTTFTDENGVFGTPTRVSVSSFENLSASVRKLGYEQVHQHAEPADNFQSVAFTLIMRVTPNEAGTAPASAWLSALDSGSRTQLVLRCAGCHQMPAPYVLRYTRLIEQTLAALPAADPADLRLQSWEMIRQYMVALSAEKGDGNEDLSPLSGAFHRAGTLLTGGEAIGPARILAERFGEGVDYLGNYDYGAPLLGTPRTVMVEYGVKDANLFHEAHLLLGPPARFWFAGDNGASAITSIGLANDEKRTFGLPLANLVTKEPFTLQRGAGGTLWVTSAVTGVLAHFDPRNEEWLSVLELKNGEDAPVAINCLGTGRNDEVMEDGAGRIWFSHSTSPMLGYVVPETGETVHFPLPAIPGRPADPGVGPGCLVMSPDRNFVWYSQTGIGVIGALDTRSHEFRTVVLQDPAAGPQRFALSDDGVLYVPLFGTGQLLVHDTHTGEQTIHDLPDRASAPYAATFDPVRRVVWVSGSNSDAIYRFVPGAGTFTVQPLPRRSAYLRRITLEPASGLLVGVYADSGGGGGDRILTVDPGDGAYQARGKPKPPEGAYAK